MTGVYQIYNVLSKKRYIGSSKNVKKRFNKHVGNFRHQRRTNIEMEKDYLKYGINSFVFGLIEECAEHELTDREQFYIYHYGLNCLYNKAPLATSNKGTSVSWNRNKKGLQKAWNKGMKGWHPEGAGVQPKPFSIVSPDLVLYEGNSIKKFAKEMGFTTGIYVLINKKSEYYKGWRLPKETDNYNGYASFPN